MLSRRLGFRLGQLAWGLGMGGLVASGCGNKDQGAPPGVSVGMVGGGARAGLGGSGGGAGQGEGGVPSTNAGTTGTGNTGGDGAINEEAPVVTITSPVAEDDPNGQNVIVDEQVDVKCTAEPANADAAEIDPSTVLIEMLDAGNTVVQSSGGTPTGRTNEYKARFITTKVADNGVISFRCSAADTANPPLSGTVRLDSLVDHGPAVTIHEPKPDSDHALVGGLAVSFSVTPAPIAKGDKGATVGTVTAQVGGVDLDLSESNGTYSAQINLNDPKLFKNPPDGPTPISIVASDKRKPSPGVNSQSSYSFVVDGTGPDIVINQPKTPQIIGGQVTVLFTVTDSQAGVDPDTIVVSLNGDAHRFDPSPDGPWSVNGNDYAFVFDARQFDLTTVQTTITVSAADKVGNLADEATENVYLDNVPPIVDLDPAPVREYNKSSSFCSDAFDPVGPLAANDLQHIYDFQFFRALVWERTNQGAAQKELFYSGTDVNSVYIVVQPDPTQPLLEDTDGDGVCDSLIKEAADKSKLPVQQLSGLLPAGSSFFGSADDENPDLSAEFPLPAGCSYSNGTSAPPGLCITQNSDMTRIIAWDVKHEVPVVYAQGPKSDGPCTGIDWQIGHQAHVTEGWLCVAAMAADNVGNVGVSRPLRLCYDDGVLPTPSCLDPGSDPPPSCTKSCTLPPAMPPLEIEL